MTDELLPWYNRELAFIRRIGAEFARSHPKIAGRLRMSGESIEDPHVSRLIESFAYLNARIRHKIEDDFPEIAESLLGILYPHYLNPIPSMAMVRFTLDPAQSALVAGYHVPRHSSLETELIQGEPCRFQTSYEVQLWPFELSTAVLRTFPCDAPVTRFTDDAVAVLCLSLRCLSPEVTFSQMPLGKLRFFLNGLPQHVYALYELLFNNVLEVVVAQSADDEAPRRLPHGSISRVGFADDESMFPHQSRSFPGYRLLTEYFAFPEKYLFVDIQGLTGDILAGIGRELSIYFYLNRTSNDLERNIDTSMFQTGCTPMTNLFRKRVEPIQLNHLDFEYRVVPDARRPEAIEIYSIDRVVATSPAGDELEYHPFYSVNHMNGGGRESAYWFAARRPAEQVEGPVDHGTEMYMSFVDLGFQPSQATDWVVDIESTCLNRDLPQRLPFGGGHPRLFLVGGGPVSEIRCLTAPTPTLRATQGQTSRWRVVSHLALGHESIQDGAEALREILQLYNFNDSEETRAMIEGILDVRSRRVVQRVGQGGIAKGVEVTVTMDEDRFSGSGLFLFATVLEDFLSLYCTINSFTQLVVRTKQRKDVLRRWPPHSGSKPLL